MVVSITSIVDSACGYAALTKALPDCEVVTAEFKINLVRPAVGERFLAMGRVQTANKQLTVCTGEIRAFLWQRSGIQGGGPDADHHRQRSALTPGLCGARGDG